MAIQSNILAWVIPWTKETAGYSPFHHKRVGQIEWLNNSKIYVSVCVWVLRGLILKKSSWNFLLTFSNDGNWFSLGITFFFLRHFWSPYQLIFNGLPTWSVVKFTDYISASVTDTLYCILKLQSNHTVFIFESCGMHNVMVHNIIHLWQYFAMQLNCLIYYELG